MTLNQSVNQTDSAHELNIKANFIGGAELLFNNRKLLNLALPKSISSSTNNNAYTLKQLVLEELPKHLSEPLSSFVYNDSVRPGLLVLINNTDWELLGKQDYVIKNNDEITFISTLHGG